MFKQLSLIPWFELLHLSLVLLFFFNNSERYKIELLKFFAVYMVKPIYSSEEESKYLFLTAVFYSETNFWKYSNIVPYQKKFCARPSRFLLEFVQKEQCERGHVIFFFH